MKAAVLTTTLAFASSVQLKKPSAIAVRLDLVALDLDLDALDLDALDLAGVDLVGVAVLVFKGKGGGGRQQKERMRCMMCDGGGGQRQEKQQQKQMQDTYTTKAREAGQAHWSCGQVTINSAMPHHVQIRATGRHVSENLHLQIAYTVVMGEPMLRFYDSSMHGTFVQSTQRQTLYADNCNPLHEYANAVRHIRGSDNVNNVRVSELHLNRFLGPEQSRIMLGELHSSVWFAISDANEMFYAACLQGQTLRAHQLQYSQIASSLFFSRLGVLDSMITAVIKGNNFKLLKLCFKYWDCPTTMDHLLLAIRMAHVDVFKLAWQHRSKTCAYDTQTILKTAAAWHHVPVILYLGHTHGIAAKRNNVVRFQRQTTSVVCKLTAKKKSPPS